MKEFEERGEKPGKGLFLHGYDELPEPIECGSCPRRVMRVYRISYDGVEAKYTVCGYCFSEIKARWGGRFHEAGDESAAQADLGELP